MPAFGARSGGDVARPAMLDDCTRLKRCIACKAAVGRAVPGLRRSWYNLEALANELKGDHPR